LLRIAVTSLGVAARHSKNSILAYAAEIIERLFLSL